MRYRIPRDAKTQAIATKVVLPVAVITVLAGSSVMLLRAGRSPDQPSVSQKFKPSYQQDESPTDTPTAVNGDKVNTPLEDAKDGVESRSQVAGSARKGTASPNNPEVVPTTASSPHSSGIVAGTNATPTSILNTTLLPSPTPLSPAPDPTPLLLQASLRAERYPVHVSDTVTEYYIRIIVTANQRLRACHYYLGTTGQTFTATDGSTLSPVCTFKGKESDTRTDKMSGWVETSDGQRFNLPAPTTVTNVTS